MSFAIRRDKEYYAIDGGFVTIDKYKLIKWFPLYLTASQTSTKLDGNGLLVVSAVEVLDEVLQSVINLAPEILEFAVTTDSSSLTDIRDLVVLRGGLLEHKQQVSELRHYIESLERDKKHLISEAEKLDLIMEEYSKVVKELA